MNAQEYEFHPAVIDLMRERWPSSKKSPSRRRLGALLLVGLSSGYNLRFEKPEHHGKVERTAVPPIWVASAMEHAPGRYPIGRKLSLPGHFAVPVVLEAVRKLAGGYECRVRLPDGLPDEAILSADEAARAFGTRVESPDTVKPADAERLRLLVESARIRLAYAHDRHFAVSLSGIRTLPHQIEAVYMRMLPQPRLRFLLADDQQQLVNPWHRCAQVIASLDYAKQDDVRERVWNERWDLIVIDEAHKCSAYTKVSAGRGDEAEKTKRYQLAERLASKADHLLLLTATPHHGDDDRFVHFIRLIDRDLFPEPHRVGDQAAVIRRDILPCAEQAALAKLTANWRSVVEDAVTTTAEREAKRTGQRTLDL